MFVIIRNNVKLGQVLIIIKQWIDEFNLNKINYHLLNFDCRSAMFTDCRWRLLPGGKQSRQSFCARNGWQL